MNDRAALRAAPTDSAALRAAYDRDGYVIFDRLFRPEETAAWKAEIRRVLPADGGVATTGIYVGLSLLSPVLKAANADARLVGPLTAVIGPDVEFLSDKLVFKNAAADFGSPWHQDWTYWHGITKVSAWIALDDASKDNGCLKLLPGSHTKHFVHKGTPKAGQAFDNQMRPEDIDEGRAVTAEVPAGSMILFHDLLLHASHPNTSGRDRWALISTYRDASVPDPCDRIGIWDHAFCVSGERRVPV